jgi:hypothetical protein
MKVVMDSLGRLTLNLPGLKETEMLLEDSFTARGHTNIRATHEKTLEVTKEAHLTTQGDCIAAVAAEKGLRDLPREMREAAKHPDSIISLSLRLGDTVFTTTGKGDPALTWDHPTDMVARVSGYTCDRTLMVHADKAIIHMPRSLVQQLKNPNAIVKVTISVEFSN